MAAPDFSQFGTLADQAKPDVPDFSKFGTPVADQGKQDFSGQGTKLSLDQAGSFQPSTSNSSAGPLDNAWDFAKDTVLSSIGLEDSKSTSTGGDFGRALGKGATVDVAQTVQGANEIAKQTPLGMLADALTPTFAKQLRDSADEAIMAAVNRRGNTLSNEMTDASKASNQKNFFGDEASWANLSKDGIANVPSKIADLVSQGKFFGSGWGDWRKVGLSATESAPVSVLSMLPVIGASKTAHDLALAKALAAGSTEAEAKTIATNAAKNTASAMGAFSEGATGAGQQWTQTYQQVMDMPQAKLDQSPQYQEALSHLPPDWTPERRQQEARKAVARAASNTAAVVAGVSDALFAGLGDRYIGGAVSGEGGRVRSMAMGALEETPTETLQSGAEQFGTNLGIQQNADPSQPLMDQVGEQAVAGGLSGGLMGVGFGAAAHTNAEPAAAAPGEAVPAGEVLGATGSTEAPGAPAAPPPAGPSGPGADGGIESMLADPKALFAAVTQRPAIFGTIEQAIAAMPEFKAAPPKQQADVAAALKEMEADPKAIFAIASQRPDVYQTIAQATAQTDKLARPQPARAAQATPSTESAPPQASGQPEQVQDSANPAGAAPPSSAATPKVAAQTDAAYAARAAQEARQRAQEEEQARAQNMRDNYEQELARADAANSGLRPEDQVPKTVMQVAAERAGLTPSAFPSAEDQADARAAEAEQTQVMGKIAADHSDPSLQFLAKNGSPAAQAFAQDEMARRAVEREVGPTQADEGWAEKLFAKQPLNRDETRRAMELGFGYPKDDGTWALTRKAREYRDVLRTRTSQGAAATSIDPNQALLRRNSDATDETLVSRLNARTGGTIRLATPSEVPVSADARAGVKIASSFGKRVVFIHTPQRIAGLVLPEDAHTIYVNVRSSHPALPIIGHELLHTLRRTNGAIYSTLHARVMPMLQNVPEYRAWMKEALTAEGQELTDAELNDLSHEELIADFMGDHMMSPAFWAEVFRGQEKSWVEKLRAAVQLALDALRIRLSIGGQRGFGSEAYVKNVDGVRRAMAEAFNAWSREAEQKPEARRSTRVAESQARSPSGQREAGVATGRGAALPRVPAMAARTQEPAALQKRERIQNHGFFKPANTEDMKRLSIPPAWQNVYVNVNPNERLLAVGVDRKGRTQYLYSAAHTAQSLQEKFLRGLAFDRALPALMTRIEADVKAGVEEAHVLRIIAKTGFRIGGEKATGDVEAIGATTLHAEHVRVDGDTTYFDFTGKRGVRQVHSLQDAAIAADMASRLASRSGKLFETNDAKVRRYFATLSDEFIVHDFRTWNATDAARQAIAKMQMPSTPEAYWDQRDQVAEIAASKLGDTPIVALASYINPYVFDGWRIYAGVEQNAARPRKAAKRAAAERGNDAAAHAADARVLRFDSLHGQKARARAEVAAAPLAARERPSRGINVEVAPNPESKPITERFNKLLESEKKEVTYRVAQRVIPMVMGDMGVKLYSTEYTIGGYQGETNPSIILHVGKVPYDTLVEVGKVIGWAFSQQAIITYDERIKTGENITGFVKVTPSRALTYEENSALFKAINRAAPDAQGFTARDGALVFGNFSSLSDAAFKSIIDLALQKITTDYTVGASLHSFRSDWVEPVTLKGTRYESNLERATAGRDSVRWQGRADSYRQEADAILRRFIDRGEPLKSREDRPEIASADGRRTQKDSAGVPRDEGQRSDAGRGRPDRGVPQGATPPVHGEVVPNSVTVTGAHFSREPRTQLSSAYYGRGMVGAERARVMASKDTRLRHRIHFYVDTGHGITPERGVGNVAHAATLNGVYDASSDSAGLYAKARQSVGQNPSPGAFANAFESLVLDSGFTGFMVRNFTNHQGAVVLLGPRAVEVAQAQIERAQDVDARAHEAATSPKNDLPQPSAAQTEAGNYKKGHINIGVLDISIENPAGSDRTYTAPDGTKGVSRLYSHYGYIRGTVGRDKDHVDVFVKPGTPAEFIGPVYVIDQQVGGKFDEHKVMLGWTSMTAAKIGYEENYQRGWDGVRDITLFRTVDDFKQWLAQGNTKAPAAPQAVLYARERFPTPDAAIEFIAKERGMSYDDVMQAYGYTNPRDYITLAKGLLEEKGQGDTPRLVLEKNRYGEWVSPDGRFEIVKDAQDYWARVDGEEVGWGRTYAQARGWLLRQFQNDLAAGRIKSDGEAKNVLNRYTPEQRGAVISVWSRIAELPGAFRFNRTEATDPKTIARDLGVDRVLANLENNDMGFGEGYIDMQFIDGSFTQVHYYTKEHEAYVDAANMVKGGFGAQAYALALTWAANNKYVLVPDPAGLSLINTYRRTEQMFSAALRLNTTKYMRPHPDQGLFGWIKNPATDAQETHNLALLALTTYENVMKSDPDTRGKLIDTLSRLHYNFEEEAFENGKGQAVPRQRWEELAKADASRAVGSGITTLQRAVLTKSILDEATHRSGAGLAALVQDVPARGLLDDEHPLRAILYARQRDPGSREVVGSGGRGGILSRAALGTARAATTAARLVTTPLDLANRAIEGAIRLPAKLLVAPVTSRLYDRVVGIGQHLAQTNPIAQQIAHGLIADYGLPEPYLDARQDRDTRIQTVLRKSKALIDQIAGLSRAEARVAYLWMQEAPNSETEAQLLAQLPEESRQVLAQMKAQIDTLGRDAVSLGLLSQESYDRNHQAYLHRTYQKYELENPGAVNKGQQAKSIRADAYRGRGLKDDVNPKRLPGVTQGAKYNRMELRAPATSGLGTLERVVYLPAGHPIPASYAGWRNDGVWEARWMPKKNGDPIGMWRDLSPEERERLGEIDEVRYAFARTMLATTRDIETARFLAWVHQTYAKSEAEVEEAGGRIAEAVDSMVTLSTYADDDWVQVPSGYAKGTKIPKYGMLAGAFVPGHIWNDIRSTMNFRSNSGVWRLYDELLRGWKISKTALSPVVHTNNIMSNFILADMADIQHEHIRVALRTIIDAQRGDEAARALMERFYASGAEGGSQSMIELRTEIIEPMLEELANEQDEMLKRISLLQALSLAIRGHLRQALAAASVKKGVQIAAAPFKTMIDAYREEDSVFRLAKFMKETAAGKSDREAGKEARVAILDYNINAPWIQALRRGPLPFVSFSYRAIPLLIQAAAKRPEKMMKYFAAGYALNALAYAMLGGAGDEDRERKLMPDEKSGRALGVFYRMLRMPWNADDGSPVFFDVRRWIPGGDIVDLTGSKSAIPLPSWLSVGGPISLFIELAANENLFTGKPIVKQSDTPVEATTKIMDHLFKFIAPNMPIPNPVGYAADAALMDNGLFQTYSWKSIQAAGTGQTDAFGRERNLAQAIAAAGGIKVGAQPADVAMKNLRGERDAQLREISETESALRREAQKGGLTTDQLRARIERQDAKARDIRSRYNERMGLERIN